MSLARLALAVCLLLASGGLAGCLGDAPAETEGGQPLATAGAEDASASANETQAQAHLSANRTEGQAPMDVTFTIDAPGNTSSSTWTLRTGDGTVHESEQTPATLEHTYPQAGTYTANLTLEHGEETLHDDLDVQVDPAPDEDDDAGDEQDEEEEDEEEEERREDPGEEESPDCLRAVPAPADPQGLVSGWETQTLDVAFAVDASFTELHEDWERTARDRVQAISAIYEEAIALEVSPVHVIALPEEAITNDDTTGQAIEDLRAYYDEHHPHLPRDAVYLFSGGNFTNAAGQAACIGGAGYTDDAYAVGQADPSTTNLAGFSLDGDVTVKIATHEIGHLLAAHHHNANCAEPAPGYDPFRPADACTIMINFSDLIQPTFSTANKLVMRGHLSAIDG